MLSMLHVGLESVEFVSGMSSVSVMQDRPLKSPPSVAITGLPIQFLYSLRFDALPILFVLQVLDAPI
jgi:hypothetical protein